MERKPEDPQRYGALLGAIKETQVDVQTLIRKNQLRTDNLNRNIQRNHARLVHGNKGKAHGSADWKMRKPLSDEFVTEMDVLTDQADRAVRSYMDEVKILVDD